MTNGGSSIIEIQQLLAVLAAGKTTGNIAEIGTAFGDGATAILSVLTADATFMTVEPDHERYAYAADKLAGTRAEVVNARWQDALSGRSPFDLIFLDGGSAEEIAESVPDVVGLLSIGGMIVKDDLAPELSLEDDPVRRALAADPRMTLVELLATDTMAVIIATRLR